MPPSVFDLLAEQRIADAIRRGELDHLPGAGRPLVWDDEPLVAPEQRMANRVLKNAGVTPAEVMVRREIATLRAALAQADDAERERIRARLVMLVAGLDAARRAT